MGTGSSEGGRGYHDVLVHRVEVLLLDLVLQALGGKGLSHQGAGDGHPQQDQRLQTQAFR